jgi:hypothetical protein
MTVPAFGTPSRVGEKIELAGFDRYSFLTSLVLGGLNLNFRDCMAGKELVAHSCP